MNLIELFVLFIISVLILVGLFLSLLLFTRDDNEPVVLHQNRWIESDGVRTCPACKFSTQSAWNYCPKCGEPMMGAW